MYATVNMRTDAGFTQFAYNDGFPNMIPKLILSLNDRLYMHTNSKRAQSKGKRQNTQMASGQGSHWPIEDPAVVHLCATHRSICQFCC